MTEEQNNNELPQMFQILEDKIKKMETFEKEYLLILSTKIDEYIKENSGKNLRKKELSSQIIACYDGLFVIREAFKQNSNYLSLIHYSNTVQEARKEFNFNKLEHVRISNKIKFYALDYFDYGQIDNHNVELEAQEDFQLLISNDSLVDDKYIRSVSDAIELGINADFERGQFIFRGQINHEWPLIPKLFRDYKVDAENIEAALCETLVLGIKPPYLNSFDPIEHLMN